MGGGASEWLETTGTKVRSPPAIMITQAIENAPEAGSERDSKTYVGKKKRSVAVNVLNRPGSKK